MGARTIFASGARGGVAARFIAPGGGAAFLGVCSPPQGAINRAPTPPLAPLATIVRTPSRPTELYMGTYLSNRAVKPLPSGIAIEGAFLVWGRGSWANGHLGWASFFCE